MTTYAAFQNQTEWFVRDNYKKAERWDLMTLSFAINFNRKRESL